MPFRAILIMLVVAVVLAVCYREPIYHWIMDNIVKNQKEETEEKPDEESEEEKENKD